ncbi:hypothetical protein GGR39_000126 [Novosphingobium fluoreni]|uniref:Uncharacterized protein n=1 Tax=Novosphingobium fluoreni TaxID=1391222 RepID=A0A7W6BX41_9SPHN|nr:hypothetical protein [Novosphingobium fluoreni]MBB3938497.1 hypothetical protein [Novosphingobium fluoreni]
MSLRSAPAGISGPAAPNRAVFAQALAWAAFATIGCATLGGCAAVPPSKTAYPLDPAQFLIVCECATPAAKEQVASQVRQLQGAVLYIHSQSQSLSVAAPVNGDAARFEAALLRVPTVIAVQALGAAQPSTPN